MKKYVVFAGVNGSGKTTLYKTNSHIQNMLRVNIDEIVRDGGHGVSDKDIDKRYYESLRNLKFVLPLCDRVELYDNSESFRQIAIFHHGVCTDKSENVPIWCKNIVE